MKIEKITENKIRVLFNSSDFNFEHLSSKNFIAETLQNSFLLAEILKKAENEVGFNTDGCRLLIESFSSSENILVFTITKYTSEAQKRKLIVRKKDNNYEKLSTVFQFETFENFCLLCTRIKQSNLMKKKEFFKNISLYLYNNTYFLIIKNVSIYDDLLKSLISLVSEFATPVKTTHSFENKLLEHGKLIIKHNAILTGIKYFV